MLHVSKAAGAKDSTVGLSAKVRQLCLHVKCFDAVKMN